MEINKELIEKAYKKLKSSVYFDKTQLNLRNRIVKLENDNPEEELDLFLDKIYEALKNKKKFTALENKIFEGIDVISLPKKLVKKKADIITNVGNEIIEIEELQHYIDMPVEGHILGVLWTMLIGYKVDKKFYEHSYGNRIRKKLISELSGDLTYSPYLFEPYFEQYESWRDKAMTEAQKHMELNQDVVIITMDFKRYYYSLDVDHSVLSKMYDDVEVDEEIEECCMLLHNFVEKVISIYSQKFDDTFNKRNILPIGFLPSNIIGNWCLNQFDKAVVDGWNPVYYGRYVDDIIIVDKVERNGDLYKKIEKSEMSKKEIIEFFLTSCSKWNGLKKSVCSNPDNYAVIQKNEILTKKELEADINKNKLPDEYTIYNINKIYNPGDKNNKSEIIVHNDKVKIFYFKWDESDALITCFKKNIAVNKSEFRRMPEDEAVFQQDDYSDIYSLSNEGTINKFRGIDDISLDKYKLSKFLGKYLRISGLIYDKVESRFEKDILKIFTPSVIIENYSMWEKIVEILIINERFEALEKFCKKINNAINIIKVIDTVPEKIRENVSKSLYVQLHAVLCRNFALVWKDARLKAQEDIYNNFLTDKVDEDASKMIDGYYKSKMVDKSVMPIFIDMLKEDVFCISSDVNLTRFREVLCKTKKKGELKEYKYYPYIINMYDFGIISCIEQINQGLDKTPFDDLDKIINNIKESYVEANYRQKQKEKYLPDELLSVKPICDSKNYMVLVGNGKKEKIRVAIANVKLNFTNFDKIVKDTPNRTYSRYKELSLLVNMAIEAHADLLIMPEAYVPFEWLSVLARTCAKNQLAIVTGVEHIKVNTSTQNKEENRIYNFTSVILPYREETHKCAHMSFHLKKYYAPFEEELIKGYRMLPVCGNHYELYKWNDCYFPVYCCYELTSIMDRTLFQSFADMIIAVEWNHDVKYYSNILESLSRDIHCYCIQVNSSDYGDSRITKPSKNEEKDIIRTKGGINSSILVDDVNISELRDFQLKEYSLQQKDSKYKVTPPTFKKDIVLKKIKHESLI